MQFSSQKEPKISKKRHLKQFCFFNGTFKIIHHRVTKRYFLYHFLLLCANLDEPLEILVNYSHKLAKYANFIGYFNFLVLNYFKPSITVLNLYNKGDESHMLVHFFFKKLSLTDNWYQIVNSNCIELLNNWLA